MPDWNQCSAFVRRALREAARFPMIVLVIVASAILAWLAICWLWRLGELLFTRFLKESWV